MSDEEDENCDDSIGVSYQTVKVLATGSFGVATLEKATHLVVLKKFRIDKNASVDPIILHFIRNEAYVLSRFSHPNIVRIYHAFEDPIEKTINLELEYCGGGNLKEFIQNQSQLGELLSEDLIKKYFSQLAVGVSYMHSLRIIHRALKSETVFLTTDKQTVKIGDFGTAKMMERAGSAIPGDDGAKAFQYMAPERFIGDVTKRNHFGVDIWSLGVILFELTTLKLPFAISTDDQVMAVVAMVGIFKGKAKIAVSIDGRYSKSLKTLVNDRLLVIDPAKRATIDEVLKADFICEDVERLTYHHCGYYQGRQIQAVKNGFFRSRLSNEEPTVEIVEVVEPEEVINLRRELATLLQEFESERQQHQDEVRSLRDIITELERERRIMLQQLKQARAQATEHAYSPPIQKKMMQLKEEESDSVDAVVAERKGTGSSSIDIVVTERKGTGSSSLGDEPSQKKSVDSILSVEDAAYLGGELLTAMVLGVPSQVTSLLDRGAHVNHCDHDNWTPLLAASLHGHLDIVTILLERGADINHKNIDGMTALIFAVDSGHADLVKTLVENGAEVHDQDNAGWSPLVYAALSGRFEIGKFLIECDPEIVNLKDRCGATPLFHAAIHGRSDFGKMLIENGAEVNIRTTAKMTYFSSAKNKLVDISSCWTALMVAAYENRTKFIKVLIDNRADVTLKNSDGQMALNLYKTMSRNDETKKLLQPPNAVSQNGSQRVKTLFVQLPAAFINKAMNKMGPGDDYVVL